MLAHAAMMAARDAAGATVPEDPSNLAVEQTSDTSARITWADNSNNEDNYLLYRQEDGGGFVLHQTLAKDKELYDDTGLTTGSTYDYKVSAENEVGESTQIGPVSVEVVADVPDAPTNLQATTVSASRVDLSWTDNADNEDEYRIYRDNTLIDTIAAGSTTYEATGLTEGTEYDWKVAAANSSGEATSSTVSKATKLAQPTGLQADAIGFPPSAFRFTWTDNSSSEANYELHKNGSLHTTVAANTEQHDIGCPDATGDWQVRAVHSTLPASEFSNGVSPSC